MIVSMPYIGLLPFLRGLFKNLCSAEEGVNALHRASPISTNSLTKTITYQFMCQCPTSGFSHFYSTL